MKRAIKWIVLVIVLLIVIAVAVVLMNLDGIIKSTVETQGTKQLQVETKLGGVHLSIFGGSLSLSDFSLGSPKGFSAPQMLSLGKADVAVSYGKLRDEPIHVSTIALDQPKLVIEQSGGSLNFKALADGLSSGGSDQPQPTPATNSQPVKLVIDQINISNAQVVLRPGVPGLSQELTIPIPTIALQNVGNDTGGAAIKDVVMQVVTAMAQKAADSDKLPPELKTLLNLNVSQVASQLGGEVQKQVGALQTSATQAITHVIQGGNAKDVEKNLKDQGKDIGKNVGGLLKGLGKPATQP